MIGLQGVQALFRKYAKGRFGIGFSDYLGLVSDVALLRTKFEWADTRFFFLFAFAFAFAFC